MKKLLHICAVALLLAALAGCGDDDNNNTSSSSAVSNTSEGSSSAEPDWDKIDGYGPEDNTVLGSATAALDGTGGRYKETVLCNFIMDGITAYARHISGAVIDFALHNGQNLKVFSIPTGDIGNASILDLLGSDQLFVCTYTGAQVKAIIDGFVNSSSRTGWSANCAVMVSKELSYAITPDDSNSDDPPHATGIRVNGAPINDAEEYRVAVGSFIGDNSISNRFFPVLDATKKDSYAPTQLRHALAMYVLAKGTIDPSDYPLGRYTGEVPEIPAP